MFKFDQVRAIFRFIKCVIFFITLLNVHSCECRLIYTVIGQSAVLNFPFPCNSTEVTLQQGVSLPFYRFTNGFALSLPQSQANRFKVQINMEKGNCSLDLTIGDLTEIDEGTYMSTIYIDGQQLNDLTTRIWLGVENPPDRASCEKVKDKGGDRVAISCTANIGNLAGKIECYQNGQQIPPLIDPVENPLSVRENFVIRKSQPAFCCSSTLHEYKDRCECKDGALNLADGDSNDPCPPSSTITTRPLISIVTENNQTNSTGMSSPPMNMKEFKGNNDVIVLSVLLAIAVLLIVLRLFVIFWKKKLKITRSKTNHEVRFEKGDIEDKESAIIPFVDDQHDQSNNASGRK